MIALAGWLQILVLVLLAALGYGAVTLVFNILRRGGGQNSGFRRCPNPECGQPVWPASVYCPQCGQDLRKFRDEDAGEQ